MAWPPPRWMAVGHGHRMAWRDVGAPDGEPWLLLHGGPGSGCQPGLLAPLDLRRQRAIAPDQRGSGASRPHGGIRRNHTPALVADLEALRQHLGLERWRLLAGSWGTVLALAYTRQHPQRVEGLVLRGAFGLTRREIGGLLLPGREAIRRMGPEPFWPARAGAALPSVLRQLTQLLQSGTPAVAGLRVARRWSLLESALAERGLRHSGRHAVLQGRLGLAAAIHREWGALRRRERRARARARQPRISQADRRAVRKYRVQAHYLRHHGFMRPAELGGAVKALSQQGVPMRWLHGRFDAVCPPANSRRWAAIGGQLTLTLSGHLGHEPDLLAALRRAVRASW